MADITELLRSYSEIPASYWDDVCAQGVDEIERLRAENKVLKQKQNCGTCVRVRGSAKCNSCALYYRRLPSLWLPAKAALRGEGE